MVIAKKSIDSLHTKYIESEKRNPEKKNPEITSYIIIYMNFLYLVRRIQISIPLIGRSLYP